MPNGYLVQLGSDGSLNSPDAIIDPLVSFTTDTNLGAGNWVWSGTYNGTTYTNTSEPGTYYEAMDGNVYFVPSYGPVSTISSATVQSAPSYTDPSATPDGTIHGTSGDDTIDSSYSDENNDSLLSGSIADSIRAGDGDDSILSYGGADTVYGGGGSDTIDAGGGADIVYGDSNSELTATSESLNWSDLGNDGAELTAGFTQTTGEMDVTVSFTDDGNNNPVFEVDTQTVYVGASEPMSNSSSLYLYAQGNAASSTTTIDFSANTTSDFGDNVENVMFRINDVDWGAGNHRDIITVNATDADGNTVAVTITPGGTQDVTGNTATSDDVATAPSDLAGSLLIEIAGPVSEITISYSNGLTNTQAVNVTDIHFDTIVPAGDSDSIDGGSGNDTLYGEDGEDTLTGGTGLDELFGGAGDDIFNLAQGDDAFGGAGDDLFVLTDLGEAATNTITITGGDEGTSDSDTLDLGGLADRNSLNIASDPSDSGALSGSVTMLDGTVVNFSEIENIICFTPGVMILTEQGPRPIETLVPGDRIVTRDNGVQTLRWMGNRTVSGKGKFAPISIAAHVLENCVSPLLVSPQHRMMFRGYQAELLFGQSEVLVAAKHLVDGHDVVAQPSEEITYIHLMFDQHEVIFANGAATESFHLADMGLSALSGISQSSLFDAFPHLRSDLSSYGPTARLCLKQHEAQLLAKSLTPTPMAMAA